MARRKSRERQMRLFPVGDLDDGSDDSDHGGLGDEADDGRAEDPWEPIMADLARLAVRRYLENLRRSGDPTQVN